MEDTELLRRYLDNGSNTAFAELVRKHINLVHATAMSRLGGDYHLAQDVTQAVFALLARKAPALRHHPALNGWLYTTAAFIAARTLRRERRWRSREEKLRALGGLPAVQEPRVAWEQVGPVIKGIMRDLSPGDREIILWRYFEGQNSAAIAGRLGIGEHAAVMRANRALERLRAMLRKRGADSVTAALALALANCADAAALAARVAAAVSTAPAGSASALPSQWLPRLAALLLIPALILAGLEYRAARRASATVAIGQENYVNSRSRLRALVEKAEMLDRTRKVLGTKLGYARKLADGTSTKIPSRAKFQQFLATYPQARELAIHLNRSLIARVYGAFFRAEHFTPAQARKFQDVLADYWLNFESISSVEFNLEEMPPPPPELVAGLLDDAGYGRLAQYTSYLFAQVWANRLANSLAGDALSTNQIDSVAAIIANHSNPAESANFDDPSLAAGTDWDAVHAETKSVLSPSQWEEASRYFASLAPQGVSSRIP